MIPRFPFRFTNFETGEVVGIEWFDTRHAETFDVIEARAEFLASMHGSQIDIEHGSIHADGTIAGWEREGIRIFPKAVLCP